MTKTVEEIHELKEYYVNELYGSVRQEQETDESYYNDAFPVPEIPHTTQPLRSGLARRIIDNPSEQMITRNPKVYVDVKNEESCKRISLLTNHWIEWLKRQNPNPFKESVKNPLLRGETYLFLQHNEALVTGKQSNNKMPVFFIIPDPMTIYGSVEEDEDGIPDNVMIVCERNLSDIKYLYPKWSNPQNSYGKRKVKWLAYWDKELRYFEADGEQVLNTENIYGFTPFIRRYSGFGRRDSANNLVNMIVGELRGSRGLLKEECLVRSDIAATLHRYAHPRELWTVPQTGDLDIKKIKEEYSFKAGTMSILPMPDGSRRIDNVQMAPVPEVFSHLNSIESEIIARHPMVLAGTTSSNSGRQDDIMGKTMMHRYETILENTETMFASGIEKAFDICRAIDYIPEGLKSEDLDREFIVSVTLKAEDSLERERQITLGDRMWAGGNGSIDLTTLHTKYYGLTQAESNDIIAKMLVDKLTLQNPEVANVLGMVYAEESGMKRWIDEAKTASQAEQRQAQSLSKMPTPTQQQRQKGQVLTQAGFEMLDQSLLNRGARQPPVNYQRGG